MIIYFLFINICLFGYIVWLLNDYVSFLRRTERRIDQLSATIDCLIDFKLNRLADDEYVAPDGSV